ncbi:hypothetical protein F4553_005737 [Allocatelliglobosispora scoriae]|uniref:DUF4097 domain-containing protein n=1 Tax=Allocatelliglobosispora scoriae TaxID=643052 RepID=A0A841BZH1_9ACTN|nr:DUF4097 family beta strand repeat-containing protein [Allocatelliglobosispora scoriae]MBB5872303.1 hypothetical protein [Allocatelliglobosispora scoriae]
MSEFPVSGPITAEIRIGDGRVEILAEPRQTATVTIEAMEQTDQSREAAARTTVEMRGDRLVVHTPDRGTGWWKRRGAPVRLVIAVPAESSVELKLASADAVCEGAYRSVTAHIASGDIVVDRASGDVNVHTASGDVRANQVGGELKIHSASGDSEVGSVDGAVQVHSASGHVEIKRASANVKATTASGDIRVGEVRRGLVKINSASGDLSVGVAPGTGVWLDVNAMSGRARSDLDSGSASATSSAAELSLHLRTMSGDVHVHRAVA